MDENELAHLVAVALEPDGTRAHSLGEAVAVASFVASCAQIAHQLWQARQDRAVAAIAAAGAGLWWLGLVGLPISQPAFGSQPPTDTHVDLPKAAPSPEAPKPGVRSAQIVECTGVHVDVIGTGKLCLDPANVSNREFEECLTTGGRKLCAPRMVALPIGEYLQGDERAANDGTGNRM